ncbi:hypothetical protein BZA70DRAFT_6624 [Myxozyma melibiosi]|uniref:Uncharacterized protein n=1 Tax=Myxozyma melibiosi TaxID=54550 RepID=A0ABR1FBI9_9ASCO
MAETDVAVDPARNLDADLDIIIDQPLLDGDDEGEKNLGDYGGDMEVDKEPSKGEELPEAYSLKRFEAVYMHGVDHMSTNDVKEYSAAYFPDEEPKFEWVDDSSIVLVFKSEEAAGKALDAFTSEGEFYDEVPADGALRVAKTHPGNGKYTLKVRGALLTDKKEKAAHLKSKYYLFHGDPREEEERRYGISTVVT